MGLAVAMMIAAVVLALGLGVWLLVTGLRGRRVDDHPLCRRCGFDLVGTVKDAASPGGACPECGARLAGARSVRVGNRVRRARLVWAGAGVLGVLLGAGGLAAWTVMSGRDPNPWKPNWWLVGEARLLPASLDTQRFADEASRRVTAGTLDGEMLRALVERSLAVQADERVRWFGAWGDVIETARAKGLVGDEAWARYVRTAASAIEVRFRDPGVSGEIAWPIEFEMGTARAGTGMSLLGRLDVESVRVGDVTIPWVQGDTSTSVIGAMYSSVSRFNIACPVEPGERTAVVNGTVHVTDARTGSAMVSVPFERRVSVRIVPTGTSLVTAVDDGAMASAMNAAVGMAPQQPALTVTRMGAGRDGGPVGFSTGLLFQVTRVPVPIAGRVMARARTEDGGPVREWRVGQLVADPEGTSQFSGGWFLNDWDPSLQRVDLVIVPDAEVAAGTIGMTRYWGREIVIKGVPVVGPEVEGER